MNPIKSRLLSTLATIFLILPLFILGSCKDLSNDPPEESGNLVVNLGEIQRQLGYATQSSGSNGRSDSVTVPGATDASNEVKSLLVGAFVVNTRNTPYTKDVAITDAIEENLKDELAGSVDYIKIVDLPTANDYIEFPYPKSELSRWQVIAVALNFRIKEFAELGEDTHEDSILYFGFSENFYRSNTIGENEQVAVQMNRACLTNPVKGCATYDDSLTGTPVVTAAVEILGVRFNANTTDFASSVSFPIIVRTSADATAAINSLKTVRSAITAAGNTITSLTVRSTHSKNTAESTACKALADNASATVAQLSASCEVQLNKITLAR
ncbi:hypothetical protein KKI24_17685 [bacterium]|nr:hypothetical protein [bacterium]